MLLSDLGRWKEVLRRIERRLQLSASGRASYCSCCSAAFSSPLLSFCCSPRCLHRPEEPPFSSSPRAYRLVCRYNITLTTSDIVLPSVGIGTVKDYSSCAPSTLLLSFPLAAPAPSCSGCGRGGCCRRRCQQSSLTSF